jgi:hypothetical protein
MVYGGERLLGSRFEVPIDLGEADVVPVTGRACVCEVEVVVGIAVGLVVVAEAGHKFVEQVGNIVVVKGESILRSRG